MKRKMIEKIPYITIQDQPEEASVYTAAVRVLEIGGEDYILLEMYESVGGMEIPAARYAATMRDWGIYWPETSTWSRGSISSIQENLPITGKCMLSSTKAFDMIKKFFKESSRSAGYAIDDWEYYFMGNERLIRQQESARRNQRRRELLKKRQADTPELEKEELLKWAERTLFCSQHILYYKKGRSHSSICCSNCGKISYGRWKRGEFFESQFEAKIQEPRKGHRGKCPCCGAWGEYVSQGKAGSVRHVGTISVFRVDKYQKEGAVVRYIELEKECRLELIAADRGEEMMGANEVLSGIEISRTYFLPGKKPQTDYHKHDNWGGKDFWDDCNLSGLANIQIKKGRIHPDTWENLKETYLRHSAMKEYADSQAECLNVKDYLENYQQTPQIEMLVKLGLTGIVNELVKYHYGIVYAPTARRMDLFLGIRKEQVKLLREHSGDIDILKILQMEKRMNQKWDSRQIESLAEIDASRGNMNDVLEHMSVQKLLNYISKQAGCEYGTECSRAVNRLKQTANMYFDYLHMRKTLGYDMENTIYLRPRSLRAAHDTMVLEQNDRSMDERKKQAGEGYPDIRKRYRSLRERYFYEAGGLRIRPARSAEEIVMEGRLLHHCVGGNRYLSRHNRGESIILLLRDAEAPDMPYITVEIQETEIVQWYGAYDKKPDEAKINKWLHTYITWLKCREASGPVQKGTAAAGA